MTDGHAYTGFRAWLCRKLCPPTHSRAEPILQGPEPALTDIPSRLRLLADRLDRNPVRYVVIVIDGKDVKVHGYGDARPRREVIGLLHEAADQLVQSGRKR